MKIVLCRECLVISSRLVLIKSASVSRKELHSTLTTSRFQDPQLNQKKYPRLSRKKKEKMYSK